jgi:cytochrome c-type biogenesis protein CcmH/NrfF
MNSYESPQTLDRVVKEKPPKRRASWWEIAVVCVVIGATQWVMFYFREQERIKKQAEQLKAAQQILNSPFPASP